MEINYIIAACIVLFVLTISFFYFSGNYSFSGNYVFKDSDISVWKERNTDVYPAIISSITFNHKNINFNLDLFRW